MKAAFTIVSSNYISFAKTLCKSYLNAHPNHEFFIILVDEISKELKPFIKGLNVIEARDIPLPSKDFFFYQYDILELNTAVKPFALKYLFESKKLSHLLYLDPDIYVFKELTEIWKGLENNSIVLTPHMNTPYFDDSLPSEVNILQSGTYNLGFIGLKNTENSQKLIEWWCEKLYLDCVVDIPRGLFVDQKWMDLVPAYFSDTHILYDQSYNVAYWNLHEREIGKTNDAFTVNGNPLSFYHYSGFKADKPEILSKYQNRHNLEDNKYLDELFQFYRTNVFENGYDETHEIKYAYNKLSNGVKNSKVLNLVVRNCLYKGIDIPSPINQTDLFCEFLTTPNPKYNGKNVAPIISALIEKREDVNTYYPSAFNQYDEGIITWMENSGEEEGLAELIEQFPIAKPKLNSVEKIYNVLSKRKDLQEVFKDVLIDSAVEAKFQKWITEFGFKEEKITKEDGLNFENSFQGFNKLMNLYFLRHDLQKTFVNISDSLVLTELRNWFIQNANQFKDISIADWLRFEITVKEYKDEFSIINLFNNSWIKTLIGGEPNRFNLDKVYSVCSILGITLDPEMLNNALEKSSILNNLDSYYHSESSLQTRFKVERKENYTETLRNVIKYLHSESIISKKDQNELDSKIAKVEKKISGGINIAGYFEASTGMGQSARSMELILSCAKSKISKYSIPSLNVKRESNKINLNNPHYFGTYEANFRKNIVIVNADSVSQTEKNLPNNFFQDKHNIGFWVWETETLPKKYKESALLFDEIWTPSKYSANAIEKTTNKPVKIVPHTLDFENIEKIKKSNKKAFDLKEVFTFGFFFDQKSILERKNPLGLIKAFKKAFGNRKDVQLLLKVNSPTPGNYNYEKIKLETQLCDNIIWVEETFDREKTLRLMNCLDCYVSLHRSEGFGLTMAEAMALGKPVIASRYSGNLDFMDDDNSILVDCPSVKIDRNYGPYLKGDKWGEPNVSDASSKMKLLFENYSNYKGLIENAKKSIYNNLDSKKIFKGLNLN